MNEPEIIERLTATKPYTDFPKTLDDAIAEIRGLRAEIARLREQLSHAAPAIDELTMEREDYKSRWLGSMTPEEAALIRAENARLLAALKAIARRLAPSTRTFDQMMRDMMLSCDIAREALTGELSKESKS